MSNLETLMKLDKNILDYKVIQTQDDEGNSGTAVLLTIGHTEEELQELTNEFTEDLDPNSDVTLKVLVEAQEFEIMLDKENLLQLLKEVDEFDPYADEEE